MSSELSERQLIERAKKGDKTAIGILYQQNVDKIFRYIAYRVPQQDAEDLTADVFTQMVKGISDFTYTGAPLEAWLYRIASTRIADYHRKKSRNKSEAIDDYLADKKPLPEENLLASQEQDRVREALTELSADDQQLLILRFVERKSHDDVAEIIGKSATAVRVAQHRALKRLAKLLNVRGKERHYLRGLIDETE